jgi:hypothetical protein
LKQNISDLFDFSIFAVVAGERGIWDDDEQGILFNVDGFGS